MYPSWCQLMTCRAGTSVPFFLIKIHWVDTWMCYIFYQNAYLPCWNAFDVCRHLTVLYDASWYVSKLICQLMTCRAATSVTWRKRSNQTSWTTCGRCQAAPPLHTSSQQTRVPSGSTCRTRESWGAPQSRPGMRLCPPPRGQRTSCRQRSSSWSCWRRASSRRWMPRPLWRLLLAVPWDASMSWP